MDITVIGGGSIGLLYAGYLGEFFSTTVYVRRDEQAAGINEQGIQIVQEQEKTKTIHVQAQAGELPVTDVYFVAVKQTQLPSLLPELKNLPLDAVVIFLQNGMGHLSLLEQLPHAHIFLGIVEHGALKLSDRSVVHNGHGSTKLGVYKGDPDIVSPLFQFQAFPIVLYDHWRELLEDKLLVNAVINPLTALHRIPNGALLENHYLKQAAQSVFTEVCHILGREPDSERWAAVEAILKRTFNNRSSMLQDIEVGLEPELDAILGYIMKRAKHSDCPFPITGFLYDNIKAIYMG